MKKIILPIILVFFLFIIKSAQAQKFTLVKSIRTNVTRVTEWKTTPLEYLAEYKKFLE